MDTKNISNIDILRAGLEAMRDAAANIAKCACEQRERVLAEFAANGRRAAMNECHHTVRCNAVIEAAIRALPIKGDG